VTPDHNLQKNPCTIQEFLAKRSAIGAIALVNKKGERIDYGVLLENQTLKSNYPNLQDDLNKTHKRRNSLPGSHPYDKRTGDKSRPLKKKEQAILKVYLDDAYNEIIKIVEVWFSQERLTKSKKEDPSR
jgi:hypothetical protein